MTPNPYRPSLSTVDRVPRAKSVRGAWTILGLGLLSAIGGAFAVMATPTTSRGMPRRYATYEPDGISWILFADSHVGHIAIGTSVLLIVVAIMLFLRQAASYRG